MNTAKTIRSTAQQHANKIASLRYGTCSNCGTLLRRVPAKDSKGYDPRMVMACVKCDIEF